MPSNVRSGKGSLGRHTAGVGRTEPAAGVLSRSGFHVQPPESEPSASGHSWLTKRHLRRTALSKVALKIGWKRALRRAMNTEEPPTISPAPMPCQAADTIIRKSSSQWTFQAKPPSLPVPLLALNLAIATALAEAGARPWAFHQSGMQRRMFRYGLSRVGTPPLFQGFISFTFLR